MQINRHQPALLPTLPSVADEQGAAQTGKEATPDVAVPGVQYTPSAEAELPDLNSLSLEQQLQLGQRMGVFTKITYSKDGLMVANPFANTKADPYAGIAAPGFARGAASAISDFQEGMAALKARAPATEVRAKNVWSSLQNAAARLNVFA